MNADCDLMSSELGGPSVKNDSNDQIDDIRDLHGNCRRRVSVDGKGRSDGAEQDVAEAQSQSDAYVDTHSPFDFF